MITIYLEPLVTLNQENNLFKPHFGKATNRNVLCLNELMNNPRFSNVLEIGQPKFIALAKKHLEQFKHTLMPKGKKDEHSDKLT